MKVNFAKKTVGGFNYEFTRGVSTQTAGAAEFGECMETMHRIKNGDFEEYAHILNLFRREVIATCNNVLLASLLDSMLERTAVVVRRMIMVPGRALEGLHDHRAVLAAMKAGKADEAERLKRSNIRAARHVFERYQQFVL